MNRQPVVAGQFYPGDVESLNSEVGRYLRRPESEARAERTTLAAMVPHAGYVFSGVVCGKTLAEARLAECVVLLGPNHTGLGASLAVWAEGRWEEPGGGLDVDPVLAQAVIDAVPGCTADTKAHVREHSLEVLVPFLRSLEPRTRIVPVAVAEPSFTALVEAGAALGTLLAEWKEPVSIVVSSDMSHYVSDSRARELDGQAVRAALTLDAAAFFETVRSGRITMCGVLPMTMALAAAGKMGASEARMVDYTTSAEVTREYEQVVGYAGIIVD